MAILHAPSFLASSSPVRWGLRITCVGNKLTRLGHCLLLQSTHSCATVHPFYVLLRLSSLAIVMIIMILFMSNDRIILLQRVSFAVALHSIQLTLLSCLARSASCTMHFASCLWQIPLSLFIVANSIFHPLATRCSWIFSSALSIGAVATCAACSCRQRTGHSVYLWFLSEKSTDQFVMLRFHSYSVAVRVSHIKWNCSVGAKRQYLLKLQFYVYPYLHYTQFHLSEKWEIMPAANVRSTNAVRHHTHMSHVPN